MSHQHHDLFENRKQFQLERLILFSDAVFAIAITLLVIEIRVPLVETIGPDAVNLKHAVLEKGNEFFGFVLSFAVIGQFWTNHHRLFGQVNNFNNSVLWLNLLMLFFIVLVPFTSGLNSHYGGSNFVWQVYSINLSLIALSLFFLYRYLGNPKRNLSDFAHNPIARRASWTRSIVVTSIFLSGALLASLPGRFAFWAARFVYFLIPVALALVNRYFRKLQQKKNPAQKAGSFL